jgi:hypothetical protein
MSISYDLYPGEVAGNIDCLLSFPPQVVIPERHDMRKHRLKVLCLNEYGQGACLLDADVVFISVTGKVTNTNEPLTFSIQYQGDRSRFLSELTEEDIALMCPKATSRT